MASIDEHIYEGAVGVEIAVLVKNDYDGEPLPLTGATVKDYYIRKPGETGTVRWSAEFDNGVGDDGWLVYRTQQDDLSVSGRYIGQTHVEKSGMVLPTSWFDFWVHPSLPPPA